MTNFTVQITYNGHTMLVKGSASPYVPARFYLKNGDPGYPAEGGIEEITEAIMVRGKRERKLSDEWIDMNMDSLAELVYEAIEDQGR